MAIADRGKIRVHCLPRYRAAGQRIVVGLLLCFAFFSLVSGQSKQSSKVIELARQELDNGNYSKAIELAQTVANGSRLQPAVVGALDTILAAQIAQENYGEATHTLEKYSKLVADGSDHLLKARVYLRASDLYRSERNFTEALRQANKAVEAAPNEPVCP